MGLREWVGLKKRNTPSAIEWWKEQFPAAFSSGGVDITPMSSLGASAVYSATKVIMGTISSLPFNVYKSVDGGQELAYSHDQYYLLKAEPNPLYTSYIFRGSLIMYYLLWGNGYAEIRRNEYDRPLSYHIIPSWLVTPELSSDGLSVRYQIEGDGDQEKRYIDGHNMIHLSDMNLDGVTGMSRISLARDSIAMYISGTRMGKDFYENGTHIGGWLEFQKKLKDEDKKSLSDTWSKVNGGLGNTGNTAILDQGTKYVPHKLTMPFSDMEYVESQKFQVADIARIFNLPPHKIGDLSKSSFSNIEQEQISYVENCIMPIAILLEQEFNRKIFRPKEKGRMFVKLEIKGLLRGDIQSRMEFYRSMWDRGIFSANDIRGLEDMNRIENGDNRFVPLNFTTVENAINPVEEIKKEITKEINTDEGESK